MHHNWRFGLSIFVSCWMVNALCGCDTVAELTFEEEQIIEASVQGLVSPVCGNAETSDAVLRFSVLTSLDARMTPGRRYAALGDVLEPGKNFNADDIVFSDGWFFVISEDGTDMTCQSVSDCPENAACMSAAEMGIDQYYYAPSRFCVYATTITPEANPGFTHFKPQSSADNQIQSLNADGRSFAFIIDNSATLDGSAETGIPDISAATDPYQYRKVGLNQFMESLALTEETQPRYEFSAHFANGYGETGVYDASPAWMRSEAVWESEVMNKYPSPSGGSPIWETAAAAMQKLQDSANTAYSRTAIAMTDGIPNEGTDDAFQVFSRLVQANASMPLHWLELVMSNETTDIRYAQAVSASCGTHYIFNNPVQFSKIMRTLAVNSESYWDVPLKFSVKLPKDRTYRLAATMVATVGNSAVTFEAHRMNEQNETMDYRMIFLGK